MKGLSAGEIQRLASEGRPRRFLAAELLYYWTVEPDKWDDVPFLLADDPTLRSEILGVPIFGEDGSRLKHVSPRQVRLSKKFGDVLTEIERILDEAQRTKRRTGTFTPTKQGQKPRRGPGVVPPIELQSGPRRARPIAGWRTISSASRNRGHDSRKPWGSIPP